MIFELCKKKTTCQKCYKIMWADDIRGKFGTGYFNDRFIYNCLNCSLKSDEINIKELVKIYQQKIKIYQQKIKKLNKLKIQILK